MDELIPDDLDDSNLSYPWSLAQPSVKDKWIWQQKVQERGGLTMNWLVGCQLYTVPWRTCPWPACSDRPTPCCPTACHPNEPGSGRIKQTWFSQAWGWPVKFYCYRWGEWPTHTVVSIRRSWQRFTEHLASQVRCSWWQKTAWSTDATADTVQQRLGLYPPPPAHPRRPSGHQWPRLQAGRSGGVLQRLPAKAGMVTTLDSVFD